MASLPLTLCLLTIPSLVHSLSNNPLLDRAIADARLLDPRRARGGSGSTYYKTCEESYGTGYADCYGTCYNAGAGEKCCEGNCTEISQFPLLPKLSHANPSFPQILVVTASTAAMGPTPIAALMYASQNRPDSH